MKRLYFRKMVPHNRKFDKAAPSKGISWQSPPFWFFPVPWGSIFISTWLLPFSYILLSLIDRYQVLVNKEVRFQLYSGQTVKWEDGASTQICERTCNTTSIFRIHVSWEDKTIFFWNFSEWNPEPNLRIDFETEFPSVVKCVYS